MLIAYFDCFAGLSSEMLLGALLGAGLSFDALRSTLSRLDLPQHNLDIQSVVRRGFPGVRLHVTQPLIKRGPVLPHASYNGSTPHPRTPAQIISASNLPDIVKQTALAIFRRLAQAEATVYGSRAEAYRKSSDLQSLVEVVGIVAGLALLNVDRVECSPLNIGSGLAQETGSIAPALSPVTAEILRAASVPVYGSTITAELITPLGAATITTLSSAYGPIPTMKIGSVGYGAGNIDLQETPNLVRIFLGDAAGGARTAVGARVTLQTTSAPSPRYATLASHLEAAHVSDATPDAGITAATVPVGVSPYSATANSNELISMALRGHQQSGRQRLAS